MTPEQIQAMKDRMANRPPAGVDQSFTKNTEYDPNNPASKRYVPSTPAIQTTGATGATVTPPAGQQPQGGYWRTEGTNEVYDQSGRHITAEEAANIPDFWSQVKIRPSGTPPVSPQVAPAPSTGVSSTPEGIKAAFGEGWQPSDIFKEKGLVDKGILGAVRVAGNPNDIFTIGPGKTGWIETPEEYKKLFGTSEQNGIVGPEITPEQAKLLGIRPEGVAELKASRQKDEEMKNLFDMAQKAGLSWDDTMKLINSQNPVDTEKIRNDLGIPDVIDKLFQMPDKTIQEIYQEAYDKSELPGLKDKIGQIDADIKKAREDLATATGQTNGNPWISESSRVGKMRMLNQNAESTVSNLENQRSQYLDSYDKGVSELEGVMLRGAQQYERQRTIYADQFNYLLGESERRATEAKAKRESENLRYMPEWLKERATQNKELTFDEKEKLKKEGFKMDENGNIVDVGNKGKTGGSLSWRNNNPGNIKFGEFAKQYGATQGAKATDGGYFAIFPDVETGKKAMIDLLSSKSYKNLTLDQAMKRWSNNGYGAEVLGYKMPADMKMKDLINDPRIAEDLVAAMTKREGWTEGKTSKSIITDMAKNVIDGFGKISNVPAEDREKVNQEIRKLRDEGYSPQWQEKRISDKQLVEVNDFDHTLDTWARVKKLAEKLQGQFGPTVISAYGGSMTAFIRQYAKDPEFATLYAEVEKAFQLYRKETTGAQASDKELRILRPNLPALNERPSVFFSKLNKTMEGTQRAKDIYLETLKKGGIDVSQFTGGNGDGMSDEEAYQEYLSITGQ